MSKIAIVNPPYTFSGRFGIRAGSRWPFTGNTHQYYYCPYPMWMGYAASYLQSKGHEVLFYDAVGRRNHDYDRFLTDVRAFSPDYIIQEISYPSIKVDEAIGKRLSQIAPLAVCGTYASVADKVMASRSYVHAVFKGVYEEHALRLAETGDGGIYEPIPKMKNLDEYPWPYRDDMMMNDSRGGFQEFTGAYTMYYDPCCGQTPEPMLFTTMSRGCPFKCSFCLWPNTMYDNQVVWRDVDKVLEEIEHFAKKGYRSVYFDDDAQNACGWTRMKQLCDGMKEIGIPWLMLGRLDLNTEEEFKYMAEHGCAGMRLGVETLSQRLLDQVNKKLKVEDIINKIEYLRTLPTNLYLLFMHGFPGETEDDIRATNDQIQKWGIRHQNPMCAPFPGTPYYDELLEVVPDLINVPPEQFDGNALGSDLVSCVKKYAQIKG